MDLQDQLQTLIDEAPQDEQTVQAIRAIAPVLEAIAQQLKHPQYHILQDLQQNWQLTTLQHQRQPELEKTVVYAFANAKDATRSSPNLDVIAMPINVIQLLFQLLSLEPVDSIIFLDTGNLNDGIEVTRQELQQLIQMQLQRLMQVSSSDIA